MSDYKIARKINSDPPNVTRSRKNALKKIGQAESDLEWVHKIGLNVSEVNYFSVSYPFFL